MTPLMIFVTCPDEPEAARLARHVVAEGLAACGNIVPAIRSIYRWEGQVQDDGESLLILKSSAEQYEALEKMIADQHPYDVPEVLALPIERGLPGYLQWMAEGLR